MEPRSIISIKMKIKKLTKTQFYRRKSSQILPWMSHFSSSESIPGNQQQVRRRQETPLMLSFCPG